MQYSRKTKVDCPPVQHTVMCVSGLLAGLLWGGFHFPQAMRVSVRDVVDGGGIPYRDDRQTRITISRRDRLLSMVCFEDIAIQLLVYTRQHYEGRRHRRPIIG